MVRKVRLRSHQGADEAAVAKFLRDIQDYARFIPHKTMPLHSWWVDAISKELTEFATVQVDRGMATISAVGDRLRMDPSIALAAIVSLGQDRFTVLYVRNIAHVSSRGAWPKTSRRRQGRNSGGHEE